MLAKVQGIFRIYKKNMYHGTTPVLSITAVNSEKYKDNENTCWIDLKSFGKQAEVIDKYFNEKDRIFISGKIQQETWEKDGQKNSKHVIIVDAFEFIEKGQASGQPADDSTEVPF